MHARGCLFFHIEFIYNVLGWVECDGNDLIILAWLKLVSFPKEFDLTNCFLWSVVTVNYHVVAALYKCMPGYSAGNNFPSYLSVWTTALRRRFLNYFRAWHISSSVRLGWASSLLQSYEPENLRRWRVHAVAGFSCGSLMHDPWAITGVSCKQSYFPQN